MSRWQERWPFSTAACPAGVSRPALQILAAWEKCGAKKLYASGAGLTFLPVPGSNSTALITSRRGGHKIQRLTQCEKQHGAVFKRGLGMTHQQMHGDDAGADDGSG